MEENDMWDTSVVFSDCSEKLLAQIKGVCIRSYFRFTVQLDKIVKFIKCIIICKIIGIQEIRKLCFTI